VDSNSKPNILKQIMISGKQRLKSQRMLWTELKVTIIKKRMIYEVNPQDDERT
jgi:hypothetical protein